MTVFSVFTMSGIRRALLTTPGAVLAIALFDEGGCYQRCGSISMSNTINQPEYTLYCVCGAQRCQTFLRQTQGFKPEIDGCSG